MRQEENNNSGSQLQRVYKYLLTHIATASMVAEYTGIEQKNITRHKRTLEKAGKLSEVRKARCQRTGHKAMYLTCNPELAAINKEPTLF